MSEVKLIRVSSKIYWQLYDLKLRLSKQRDKIVTWDDVMEYLLSACLEVR